MVDGQIGELGVAVVWRVEVELKHARALVPVHLRLEAAECAQELVPSPNRATQMDVPVRDIEFMIFMDKHLEL